MRSGGDSNSDLRGIIPFKHYVQMYILLVFTICIFSVTEKSVLDEAEVFDRVVSKLGV